MFYFLLSFLTFLSTSMIQKMIFYQFTQTWSTLSLDIGTKLLPFPHPAPVDPAPPWLSAPAASKRIRRSCDRLPPSKFAPRNFRALVNVCLPWRRVTAVPSTGLESIDGVITKFLQDKDSLHCIALFNVTQLYENLKTENGGGEKTNKNKTRTLLTQQQWMRSQIKRKRKRK